jgi:hypothetical protein
MLGALALACLLLGTARSDDRFSANAVKAAYLYRITGYVGWPGGHPSDAPFTIAVLKDSAVADDLKQIFSDHQINGHPTLVRSIEQMRDLGDAQLLYIGPEFTGDVRAIIASVADRPVLVVTDEERGLDDGSAINFVEEGEHVRFEVSLIAAHRAGLSISSQLLSVALRVEGKGHIGSRSQCLQGLKGGSVADCVERRLVRSAGGEQEMLK